MGKNLITRAEYKAYAGLTSTNHDAEIDILVPKVSQFVKSYCRRSLVDFYEETKIEHFNGGTSTFILSETPVIQVIGVAISNTFGRTYTDLVEFADWVLDNDEIVPTTTMWASKLKGYEVRYTAGYSETPEDLKLAVLDLVSYYRQNDGAVHSSKAPGTNSVQIDFITNVQLPAHIRRILDLYKSNLI